MIRLSLFIIFLLGFIIDIAAQAENRNMEACTKTQSFGTCFNIINN
jgi:hypothetical protein